MNYSLPVIVVCWLAIQPFVNAALTTIAHSPDAANEPSLVGINPFPGNMNPSVLETLYGETNLRRVDDAYDIAFRHTGAPASVKAVARFNNPSIEERFAYSRPTTASWPDVLRFQRVAPTFQYPLGYTVPTTGSGLIPLSESGPVFEVRARSLAYSNPSKNVAEQDMMVTFEIIGNVGRPANQIGNFVVGFEIFPNDDRDFQDVVYEFSGVVPVPEPSSALVWSAAVACAMARRRR